VSIRTTARWWRLQLQDALELFVLPALAAVLPWRMSFALYKRLAHWPSLYRQATDAAWPWVQRQLPLVNEAQWRWERRLLTLVDHADWVLSKTRTRRWLQKHVLVQGQWPSPQSTQVICTFHWGAGMWTLQSMRDAGLQVHALAASLQGDQFKGRPVLHAYARLRTAQVVRTLGYPTVDVTASMRPVLQAIKDQDSLLGVVDVPADNFASAVDVQLLGQSARVPRGLLRLAADRQLPVTVFLAGLDFDTGQRHWQIHSLGVSQDAADLFKTVFQFLDQAILESPSAWHLWAEMPRFMTQPD
jgi:hypothetical protein